MVLKRLLSAWLALVFLVASAGVSRAAASGDEYAIKAAFVYHFGEFIEWPQPPPAGSPFVIGILGDDPFGRDIDALQNEFLRDRPIVVKRFRSVEEISDCQILYISHSESARLPEILERLRGKETLTVSDIDNFAAAGGMINFVKSRNKIRFAINKQSVDAAGLKVSSQLLSLAQNVIFR